MTAPDDRGGDAACWAHLFDSDDDDRPGPVVADLGAIPTAGRGGAVWSLPHGGDLDVNLVRLRSGDEIAEHVNDEVDVVIVVQSGTGRLAVDGQDRSLRSDVLATVPRGSRRSITPGAHGLTYLSIHRRRGSLTVKGTRPST